MNILIIIFIILFNNYAYATVPVKNAYTNVPVNVCIPLDPTTNCTIGSGGVAGYWTSNGSSIYNNNSGNVGIGTAISNTAMTINGQLSLASGVGGGFSIGTSAVMIGTTGTGTSIVTNTSPTLTTPVIAIVRGGTATTSTITLEATSGNSPTVASYMMLQNTGGTGTTMGLSVDSSSNIGIGTKGPNSSDLIVWGGVGIGTGQLDSYNGGVVPAGGLIVQGNIGIGSITPGTKLDINGTMRMIGTGAGSFRIQAGSNTACTTTCTTGKAIVGLDDGTLGVALPHLVGPSDATAEECLCGS